VETHPVNSHRILRNRPRSAAVIAGVLLALATANLLMALAGGLGLWTFGIFNLEGMRNISFGLGAWTIAAWTIAGFVGGFVAVTVSRSFIRHDAYVYGLVTWAATCITALVLMWNWLMVCIASGIASRDMVSGIGRRIMLGFFIANLSAFAGTLLGAAFGARRQASLLDAEIEAHGFSAKAGHASGPAEKRV
jgi:hypothetical protein